MARTIKIRHTRRNLFDLGTYQDGNGKPHHLVLGSTDDAGVVGAAQPEIEVQADVWEAAMTNKAVRHAVDRGDVVVYG